MNNEPVYYNTKAERDRATLGALEAEKKAREIHRIVEKLTMKESAKERRAVDGYIVPVNWTKEERQRLKELDRGLSPLGYSTVRKACEKAGVASSDRHVLGKVLMCDKRRKLHEKGRR